VKLPGITYDSNQRFSASQRIQLFLFPPLMAAIMRLLFCTIRLEIRGADNVDSVIARHGHTLMAIWHESSPMACWFARGRNYHTLTSHSFDGELAARILHHFRIEAVRGSSSRGGAEGLRQLQLATQVVAWVGFTLDGPRGPRRVAKAGIGVLAARTRLPVVPLAIVPLRCIRLNSWDHLPIPLPFSRIICALGEPVPPPPSESAEDVELTRLAVEQSLNRLQEQVEAEAGAAV